jgi:hypothetical protein
MTRIYLEDVRGAALDCEYDRDTIDRMLADAGEYDKDCDALDCDDYEYAEQVALAAALRAKRNRELRREVSRARQRRFF